MKILISLALGFLFVLVSCNNKNSTNSGTYANGIYYMSNGSCYSSATNQIVATTLCTSTCNTGVNTGYYWNGGICYSSATNQQVTSTLCSSATTASNGYYMSGGLCYASATGQQVTTTLCTSSCATATGGYYMNGGLCYASTGQVMDNSYCLNNSTYGATRIQCVGQYIYTGDGYERYVNCYGNYCSNTTLIDPNTRRTVYCL